MAHFRSQLRVVWAIDPFEEIDKPQRRMAAFVRTLARDKKVQIVPVTVLRMTIEVPASAQSTLKQHFLEFSRSAVGKYLKSLRISLIEVPVVLLSEAASTIESARLLLRTEGREADLLLVTTRKKIGLDKIFGESFAETLLYEAKSPVLVIGPQVKSSPPKTQHILFPTDFSPASERVFQKTAELAQSLHARMTILHAPKPRALSPHPLIPSVHKDEFRAIGEQDVWSAKAIADRWGTEAEAMGVSAKLMFIPGRQEPFEAILAETRRGSYSLIVMQDKSSPHSTNIIGSNTRQVVRHSRCPVLVLTAERRKIPARLVREAA